MATKADELLGLSDEDFANLNGPPEAAEEPAATGSDADADVPAAGSVEAEPAAVVTEDDGLTDAERAAQADDGDDPDNASEGAGEGDAADADASAILNEADDKVVAQDKPSEVPVVDPAGDKATTEAAAAVAAVGDKPVDKSEEAPAAVVAEVTPEQASAFYKQVMAPFKANGKTIELKSPEDVISLMQMGANYTKKLQDIQPHRKMLLMLQNNGLLDEGKLNFLIDLEKGNPDAIKKLVKDKGIDPLDIDTQEDPAYSPGAHQVSDEEVTFRTVMDDLKSNPSGTETIAAIHDTWDNASKEALWEDPSIMTAIHEQRESGVYALITTEMDRQRTLGRIPANVSFLDAYKAVGDAMMAEATGAKTEPEAEPAGEVTPPVVVTRAAAAPKSKLANADKAAAASPTRSSPKTAKVLVNPLAMSDEEFSKLPNVG